MVKFEHVYRNLRFLLHIRAVDNFLELGGVGGGRGGLIR